MNDSYSPRPLASEDKAEVQALSRLDKQVQVSPWTENQFIEEIKQGGYVWVITDDETDEIITAYIVFRVNEADRSTEVLQLGVALEFRGLGQAHKLIQLVVSESLRKNSERILLNVAVDNSAAVALYQKNKFVITGTRKDFYSNGQSAYQMELGLKQSGVQILDNF